MPDQYSILRRARRTLSVAAALAIGLAGLVIGGCDSPTGGDPTGDVAEDAPYGYAGTVSVTSASLEGDESFSARVLGNNEGTFDPALTMSSRAISESTVLRIPDVLKRYPDIAVVDRKSYGFSEFKLVADVILKPAIFIGDAWNQKATLLSWAGDGSDLSTYIDLVSGEFVTSEPAETLYQTVYDSVLIQINAPAQTIVPDFGSDTYPQISFSWEDVKPFYSGNSSAAHVVYSTFVVEPFVSWIGVRSDGFESLATVQEYYQRQVDDGQPDPHELVDFEDWAFNAPINHEFFDEIEALNLTEDPHSGEAWLFMPLSQPIDLTALSAVTFSVEFYMKDLFEVLTDENGQQYSMLSSAVNFRNDEGEYFFGPLPVRISYLANDSGFAVDPMP